MSVLNTKNKMLATALAVVTVASVSFSSEADAQYRRGYGYGPAIGLGVLGGVAAGAIIANQARPRYYDEPAYVVDDGPVCHIERRKIYLDDQTYKIRRVRVCD